MKTLRNKIADLLFDLINNFVVEHKRKQFHLFETQELILKEVSKRVKRIIGKVRIFPLRKDNPQYSLGQTNGYYIAIEEFKEKARKEGFVCVPKNK